ncbi:hypothetical protein SH203_00140 [Brevundimonas sp. SH203]|uniref:LPD7 domain-containing protein n=1 Tax=Brevundimonas sp. SH203 TaxID=345167 RepID=UPI0009D59C62|nr:LPD7 domain-containing protein [Brevundimonas sp. SH203]GAW39762.1 hypothetical protein SH203_00140 [Brevundimonas sp. SH203]
MIRFICTAATTASIRVLTLSLAQAFSKYPDTVADMLKVAQHRGWSRLKVEGEEAFRREVWVQARSFGMEVRVYRARGRDREAAGLPDRRAQLEVRLRMASAVVCALIADPEAKQRLIAYATARAGLDRMRGDANRSRDGGRDRDRGRR